MRLNSKKKLPKSSRQVAVTNTVDKDWPEIKNMVDAGLEARRPFEQQWALNIAFLSGRQDTFFNASAHMLQRVEVRPSGAARIIDNVLIHKWARQVADLIKTKPSMSVVPGSNEDEDIQAAKVGSKFLEHFWRDGEMPKKIRRLAGWMYGTGNGFLADTWNKRIGPEMADPTSGKIVYAGDAEVSTWSPFEILVPNALLIDHQKSPWFIKYRWYDLKQIATMYKRGSEVSSEDRGSNTTEMVYMMDRFMGENSNENEGAYVYDIYIQPCEQYPKGKFFVAANGVVLEQDDYPFNYYAIEQFKDFEIPGVFWGDCRLTFALPLQVVWNNTLTDMNDFNKTMARGKGLLPRGANLEAMPDDQHGEWLEYTPVMGLKPEQMTLKGLPTSYDAIMMSVKSSIDDLFSQHEVTRGTNKSDIRSGEMVALLREQDAHGSIGSHAIFEESLQNVMRRVLKRVQAGYSTDRMIKIRGREGDFEVFAFKGADLRNHTDVHVVEQSSVADSRVSREAAVLKRFEIGLYGNPEDPEVRRHVMQMLKDAVVENLYSDTILDESYARFENRLLMQPGIKLIPNQYDNHSIHMKEHGHHQKKIEFQRLRFEKPKVFQELDMGFEEHKKYHMDAILEAQQRQMELQAQARGK